MKEIACRSVTIVNLRSMTNNLHLCTVSIMAVASLSMLKSPRVGQRPGEESYRPSELGRDGCYRDRGSISLYQVAKVHQMQLQRL